MNTQEIIKKAINDANTIMQDKSDAWLSCAQYTRSHWDAGCEWYDYSNKVTNRGKKLIDAAISCRLGCRSIVTQPGLFW